MQKFFNGTGFSPADAMQNAQDQIEDFIQKEKEAGKQINAVSTDIETTSQDGNLNYCTLKLSYDEK